MTRCGLFTFVIRLAGNGGDATSEVLTARGVRVSRVAEIPGVCRQAFFADPTGNKIELNQPLKSAR